MLGDVTNALAVGVRKAKAGVQRSPASLAVALGLQYSKLHCLYNDL